MKAVPSETLASKIADALGIDMALVTEISISMRAKEVATITTTRVLTEGQGEAVVDLLTQYRLSLPDQPRIRYKGAAADVKKGG